MPMTPKMLMMMPDKKYMDAIKLLQPAIAVPRINAFKTT